MADQNPTPAPNPKGGTIIDHADKPDKVWIICSKGDCKPEYVPPGLICTESTKDPCEKPANCSCHLFRAEIKPQGQAGEWKDFSPSQHKFDIDKYYYWCFCAREQDK
jgi:hypothetical protein